MLNMDFLSPEWFPFHVFISLIVTLFWLLFLFLSLLLIEIFFYNSKEAKIVSCLFVECCFGLVFSACLFLCLCSYRFTDQHPLGTEQNIRSFTLRWFQRSAAHDGRRRFRRAKPPGAHAAHRRRRPRFPTRHPRGAATSRPSPTTAIQDRHRRD